MRFPSSNVLSEENSSTCTDKASSQTDMERMENPFRNLHPKIYYRQKNAEPKKVIIDNKREMELKPSPLLSVNLKTDHSSKHSNLFLPIKVDDCSAAGGKATRREQHDNFAKGLLNRETYLKDQSTVTYLNQRNIYLSEDSYTEEKLALPLIVLPSAAKDNTQLMTGFVPSSKSNKGLFPSIKEVPSFIPLVHEEEKRKAKRWRKRIRVTQTEKIDEQGAEESWLNTYAAYPAYPPAGEDLSNHIIQRKASNFSRTIADKFSSRNYVTSQTQSALTYRHSDDTKERDYMIVKAKIHRSSFL